MKRRLSVFLLAVLAVFVFAGCSSNDPVKTTPESVPATQVPNDADQGGGAGGTSDKNNDGTPDERVEDGLDDVKQDVENGVDDVKDGVKEGMDDMKRGIDDAADRAQNEMNRMKDKASESMK